MNSARRALAAIALALVMGCATSCVAATLAVQATAPRYHASAVACSSDVASPMDSAMVVTMRFSYISVVRGGHMGEGQVLVHPGQLATFEAAVPEGSYRVTCRAVTTGGEGCADTLTTFAGAVPGAAKFVRPYSAFPLRAR